VFIVPETHTKVWSFAISSPKPLPFGLHADEAQIITNDLTMTPDTPSDRPLGIYLLNRERKAVWRYVGFEADEYPSQSALVAAITDHLSSDQALSAVVS